MTTEQIENTAEYILGIKIQSAIYQALIETKKEDPDLSSLDELAFAIASDAIRNLQKFGLIELKKSEASGG